MLFVQSFPKQSVVVLPQTGLYKGQVAPEVAGRSRSRVPAALDGEFGRWGTHFSPVTAIYSPSNFPRDFNETHGEDIAYEDGGLHPIL